MANRIINNNGKKTFSLFFMNEFLFMTMYCDYPSTRPSYQIHIPDHTLNNYHTSTTLIIYIPPLLQAQRIPISPIQTHTHTQRERERERERERDESSICLQIRRKL
jgi:hypothetical protein